LSPPSTLLHPEIEVPTLRFRPMSRPPRANTRRSAFHALGRRYRVSPRPPVVFAPARRPRVPASRTGSPDERHRHRPLPPGEPSLGRSMRPASRSRLCTVGAFGPVVARRPASTGLNVLRLFLRTRRSSCGLRGGPSVRRPKSFASDGLLRATRSTQRILRRSGRSICRSRPTAEETGPRRRPKPPKKPSHPSSSSHTAGIACDTP
jgi:hypothetical protein